MAQKKFFVHRPGLYIHVPFCKSRCIYCDFYSTVRTEQLRDAYVEALCSELKARRSYLEGKTLNSLYIGGGTPSALTSAQLERIFSVAGELWDFAADAEITLEVNPDDITADYAQALAALPVNRVSMGVQTFSDEHLRLLNRRHTARQAVEAISRLGKAGINNFSIDLIYGLPEQTIEDWQRDMEQALALPVSHLSAYALTYEEGTRLDAMRKQGALSEADEELSLQMFQALMERAEAAGLLHYEISNFALPGREAVHNSGYWSDMHYLGVGPSAHSYNGTSRCWNSPDLKAYIASAANFASSDFFTQEHLTPQMKREETLLTRLRRAGGIDLAAFRRDFGEQEFGRLLAHAQTYINSGHLTFAAAAPQTFLPQQSLTEPPHTPSATLCLTRKGIFISDDIISSLF